MMKYLWRAIQTLRTMKLILTNSEELIRHFTVQLPPISKKHISPSEGTSTVIRVTCHEQSFFISQLYQWWVVAPLRISWLPCETWSDKPGKDRYKTNFCYVVSLIYCIGIATFSISHCWICVCELQIKWEILLPKCSNIIFRCIIFSSCSYIIHFFSREKTFLNDTQVSKDLIEEPREASISVTLSHCSIANIMK